MNYISLTLLAALLVIEWGKRKSDAMAYETTIDDLRRENLALVERNCASQTALAKSAGQFSEWLKAAKAENAQLRARVRQLESPVDYLAKENDD